VAGELHRITQETLNKLKAEHELLTTVGRVEIARTIETARLMGDLSENGDYHAAKDDQGKMESRIRQIDAVLRNHEIVEKDSANLLVGHTSIVGIVYDGDSDDDVQEFFIGSIEEKPEGVLVASPTSPLGAALLEKSIDAVVTYEAPSGKLTVRIATIR
jgi:transcription elongation factor GreA